MDLTPNAFVDLPASFAKKVSAKKKKKNSSQNNWSHENLIHRRDYIVHISNWFPALCAKQAPSKSCGNRSLASLGSSHNSVGSGSLEAMEADSL